MNRRWRGSIAVTGAALYLASLMLPAAGSIIRRSSAVGTGLDAFLGGFAVLVRWEPMEIDWWVFAAAWLVNPAIWIAVIAAGCGCWRTGAIAASYGLALWLLALSRFSAMVIDHPGYWTWGGSAAFLFVACTAVLCRQDMARDTP